jgi:hypothetical protein
MRTQIEFFREQLCTIVNSLERAEQIKIQQHMHNVTLVLDFAQGISYEWKLTAENFDKYLLAIIMLYSDKLKTSRKQRKGRNK